MAKNFHFKIVMEQDEDGVFVATVPAIPGCYSQGDTCENALAHVREAIEMCLETAENDSDYKAQIDFSDAGKSSDRFLGITTLPVAI